jgi:hypothetical protein
VQVVVAIGAGFCSALQAGAQGSNLFNAAGVPGRVPQFRGAQAGTRWQTSSERRSLLSQGDCGEIPGSGFCLAPAVRSRQGCRVSGRRGFSGWASARYERAAGHGVRPARPGHRNHRAHRDLVRLRVLRPNHQRGRHARDRHYGKAAVPTRRLSEGTEPGRHDHPAPDRLPGSARGPADTVPHQPHPS